MAPEYPNDPLRPLSHGLKLQQYKEILTLNFKNDGHLNPVLFEKLGKVSPPLFSHVAIFDPLSDGTRAGLMGLVVETEGAIKVSRSKSGRTGRFRMTLLTIKYPVLRPPKGRVTHIPAKVDDLVGKRMLVLDLQNIRYEIPESRKPRTQPPAAAGLELAPPSEEGSR